MPLRIGRLETPANCNARAIGEMSSLADDLLTRIPVLQAKISKAIGQSDKQSFAALTAAIQFLHLVADSHETLSPPHVVDLAWHEFILCTREYADFCQQRFGRFIHHQPGGRASTNKRQYRRTLALFAERFGVPPVELWGNSELECGVCDAGAEQALLAES